MKAATKNNPTVQQKVEKNFRWNFVVNTLDGASFWFGMSFMSSSIILPLYISHFTSNPLLIGLIPFLNNAGIFLPQLFTANVVERSPLKKFFPVTLGFFLERLPILLLAPAALLLASSQPKLALIAFFLLYSWNCFGTGSTLVGWQDMIAKIIPMDKRGRFFGITNFLGNGTGILGAVAVPFILARFAFPLGFAISFGIAAVFILISWIFLSLTREQPVISDKAPVSQLDYLRSLPEVLRKDRNFRTYILSQIIFSLSGMAVGFLAVYTVKTWSLPDAQASGFTITYQVGLTLAYLLLGFLSDRKGHKLNLEIGMVLNVLSLFLAFLAPGPVWFFLIFFVRGIVYASFFISAISITYEFTEPENRPTYIGLSNTIPGVAGTLAPLLGGLLVGVISYQAMFLISALIGTISFVLLRFKVNEPRKIRSPIQPVS